MSAWMQHAFMMPEWVFAGGRAAAGSFPGECAGRFRQGAVRDNGQD